MIVSKLSSRRQFVVPKGLADQLHLKEGDLLKISRQGAGFYVVPVDVEERYPADLVEGASLALEKDLEEGKTYSSFDSMNKELRARRHSSSKSKHA